MSAKFGLGLAALGRPGYINLGHGDDLQHKTSINAMRKQAHSVLDAAWRLGVRHFDAARSYGRAEDFLGSWIRSQNISPADIFVSSKWGYTYTAEWRVETPDGVAHEVKRHELDVLESQFETSSNQLGTHLNLYQIHSATLESGVLENKAVLEMLNQLRETGIDIGLSVSGVQQSQTIQKALAIELDGVPLFSSIQATWNILETSAAGALAEASAMGRSIIIKEALANGRLTAKNKDPEFAVKLGQLEQIASQLNTTIDALSLAAAFNQRWASVVLSGAVTIEHLESNLSASVIEWNREVQERLEPFSEVSNEYWLTRSQLAWN